MTEPSSRPERVALSPVFLVLSMLFTVCLLLANLLAARLVQVGPFVLSAAVLVFPVSYIVGDCVTEVWGWSRSRLLIWTAFLLDVFAILILQIAIWLPFPPAWTDAAAFERVFGMAPRVTLASFLAFLAGSFVNAGIMSSMKRRSQGRGFSLRAVVSTLAGEGIDSLVFFPLAFHGILPASDMLAMMAVETASKTMYEVLVLPLTMRVVTAIKRHEGVDAYDDGTSYRIWDIKDIG